MSQSGKPDRSVSQRSKASRLDWTRTPAAIFVCTLLAIASVSGLIWSWDRSAEHDKQDMRFEPAPSLVDQRPGQQPGVSPSERVVLSPVKRIDINHADRAQLDLLPAIGPALADRIVTNRDEFGRFKSVEDLQRVSGIGPKTIEKLRSLVIIGD